MATLATASSRMSIDRSSRACGWTAREASWVCSTITGSSSTHVWMIVRGERPAGHHRRGGMPCRPVAGDAPAIRSEP